MGPRSHQGPEPTLTDSVMTLTSPTEAFGCMGGRRGLGGAELQKRSRGVWSGGLEGRQGEGWRPGRLGDQRMGFLGVARVAAQGRTQRVPGGKWTWGPESPQDPEPTLTDAVTTLTSPGEAFGSLGGRRRWAAQNVKKRPRDVGSGALEGR